MDIGKKFDYLSEEQKLYKAWEDSGYFNPDKLPGKRKKNWCTIMPPPNANGRLHVGHGLDVALKDALTRFWRLKGKRTLFLPGSDHAGFETQVVYEKKLEKEGRSRFQMDAQELYKEMMAFTLENKKLMEDDVRRLGSSCDWSREKFSLDEDIVEQVQQSFIQLYKDGLVYRDKRIVNWCTKHQTSLSEVETEFIEQADPFYYFQYGPFVIGTSRPETKFGDKYVVMHPDDERYKEYHQGQQIELEWINGPIRATVIKDEAVDREFGSGVMTITPWHDQADFEIAQKHNLDKEQIIDERGKLLPIAGELSGMKIFEAREK
ncbi:MAG: class I tRNA ligase family protein, partial [Candidatus Harrisonbacteria bacterium]|nr:class I tRNA ligase family protein [Candidatus Harrisonbacteria bacterium]